MVIWTFLSVTFAISLKKTLLEEKAVIAKLGESQLSYSLTGTFKMRTAVTESCDSRAW